MAQDAPRPRPWEVGVDALSLLKKNHFPAYSLFISRTIGDKGFALRSRIGIEGSSFKDLTTTPLLPYPYPNDEQKMNFFGTVGIQQNLWVMPHPIKLATFYTGADLGLGIEKLYQQELTYFVSSYWYFERTYTTTNYMIAPFIGYSQNFMKNFKVRIEMAAVLLIKNFDLSGRGYSFKELDSTRPFTPVPQENYSRDYGKHRALAYQINPINQIIFSYSY